MQHTDLLMIGCGPSNLAVGVALEECAEVHNINSSLILEKDTSVCWHRGMLFPEAQSQVSFLKDLVTQRDPTSRFSFLNFLHKTNRLDSFV
ncbi:SidA/IucD/PvdA family monooxygenase, partial [Serratia marcescens]|uniref:SidA/IucD/PvdA family monooxygenase n=3 Tax=Serratia TaxID=613 RepID=UPI000A3FC108